MRTRIIFAALVVVLVGSGSTSAQVLSLDFQDGRVRLMAENVPVSQILAEWSRKGGTTIVNGERVPGAPLSLQLNDVPERQALETVLRGAAGYMVLGRDTVAPGTSSFDKILVLPTTARAPVAPSTAPPTPSPQPQLPTPIAAANEDEEDDQAPDPATPPAGAPPPAFPRGRLPQGLNLPNGAPPLTQPQDNNGEQPPAAITPGQPRTGNPFGIVPGSDRPGVVNPPPPQPRDPNEAQRAPNDAQRAR